MDNANITTQCKTTNRHFGETADRVLGGVIASFVVYLLIFGLSKSADMYNSGFAVLFIAFFAHLKTEAFKVWDMLVGQFVAAKKELSEYATTFTNYIVRLVDFSILPANLARLACLLSDQVQPAPPTRNNVLITLAPRLVQSPAANA
jgi:hypothetical protein